MYKLLPKATTAEEMESTADAVLKYNKSVSLAYSAKARVAYSRGSVLEMIDHSKNAIKFATYSLSEYTDYFDRLNRIREIYANNGDAKSAAICLDYMNEIPKMLASQKEKTSEIAWKIKDKPELDLPDSYVQILDRLNK